MITPTHGALNGTNPGRVLVVDDSGLIRAIVGRILESAGFCVTEAEDGAEALSRLDQQPFDVVVTDLQMPGLDGLALLSAVRQRMLGTEVVVLAGTHPKEMESAIHALRLGAHDYLTKPPSSPDVVIYAVQRAFEKKRLHDLKASLPSEAKTPRADRLPTFRESRFPRMPSLARFAWSAPPARVGCHRP